MNSLQLYFKQIKSKIIVKEYTQHTHTHIYIYIYIYTHTTDIHTTHTHTLYIHIHTRIHTKQTLTQKKIHTDTKQQIHTFTKTTTHYNAYGHTSWIELVKKFMHKDLKNTKSSCV